MLVLRLLGARPVITVGASAAVYTGDQGPAVAALQLADPQIWRNYPVDILGFTGLGAADGRCISSIYRDGPGVLMRPSRARRQAALITNRLQYERRNSGKSVFAAMGYHGPLLALVGGFQ